MDTLSCINALRHFFVIRMPAKHLRSEHATNFIGACKELGMGIDQQGASVHKCCT